MANRLPAPLPLRTLRAFLMIAVSLVTYAALAIPVGLRPAALPLRIGDVAPRDFQAPRDLEYVSQVRTEEARAAAEKAVQPVYTPPDPAIARQQIDRLDAALQTISSVRLDPTATLDQKQAELASLQDVKLKPESIQQILSLPDSRWSLIQQESLRVLEEVMRAPVRVDTLEAVKEDVPSRVSLTLSEQNTALVMELVDAFVVPNSQYSQDLTTAAQQSARQAVAPVVQLYKAGETIVSGGDLITPAQMEALQQFGLTRSSQPVESYLGAGALTVLCAVFVGLYFYPLPAVGLLLNTLFGMEASIVISFAACVLAAYGLPNTLDLTPYYLLSTLCGILALGPARRFWAFFRAGFAVAGAGIAMILAYRLPTDSWDLRGLLELMLAALTSGVASASIALLLQIGR